MLPNIPPTTLYDMAREHAGYAQNSGLPSPHGERTPALSRLRSLIATNPVSALRSRAAAWRLARDERRYGTRIVSRSADHRPVRPPVTFARHQSSFIRDRDLAA